jgi:hypothetical protein
MVLISVDLPHPLGPRIHTCSPAPIRRVTSSKAGRCSCIPRRTVTCSNERSGCDEELIFDRSCPAHLSAEASRCKKRLKIQELETAGSYGGLQNKKEVKTGTFSPPGVGGVLHDNGSRRHSRPALPGRTAASLADCIWQFVRRLTTKKLVFVRFSNTRRCLCQRQKHRFGAKGSNGSNWVADVGRQD